MAFATLGGVPSWARASTHLALALALLLATRHSDSVLDRLGALRRPLLATCVLGACVAAGLVPLPGGLLSLLEPGRPLPSEAAWGFVSRQPEATLGRLFDLTALAAMGTVAAASAVRRRSRRPVGAALLVTAVVAAAAVAVHEAAGLRLAFGLWAPAPSPRSILMLPVVNPNHVAALANLLLPMAAATMLSPRTPPPRVLGGVAAVVLVALVWWTGSRAGLSVMACALVAVVVLDRGERARWRVLAALLLVSATAGVYLLSQEPGRPDTWLAGLRALADHPLLGVGGGAFDASVDSYRRDLHFTRLAHAHSDPLEWLVETGLVGGLGGMAALAWARPRELRDDRTGLRTGILVGLASLATMALVDFPLQIPAVALAVAALLGVLWGALVPHRPASPRTARAAFVLLAVVQLAAAGWRAREAVADGAEHDLRSQLQRLEPSSATLERLERTAPWRPLVAVARLAVPGDDLDAATAAVNAFPGNAEVLRAASTVALRARALDDATRWLQGWATAAPFDWRPHVALARTAGLRGRCDTAEWADAFRRDAPLDRVPEAVAACPGADAASWAADLHDVRPGYVLAVTRLLRRRDGAEEVDPLLLHLDARAPEDGALVGPRAEALARAGQGDVAFARLVAALEERPTDQALARQLRELVGDRVHPERLLRLHDLAGRAPALQPPVLDILAQVEGPREALLQLQRWRLEGRAAADLAGPEARLLALTGDLVACQQVLARAGRRAEAEEHCRVPPP